MIETPEGKEDRSDLIKVINSPLGFFALSLLTVEGFLTITLVFSGLSSVDKFWGMVIGAGLFLIVVVGVFFLVCNYSENLTYGEQSNLEREKMKWEKEKSWATKSDPKVLRDLEKEDSVVPTKI